MIRSTAAVLLAAAGTLAACASPPPANEERPARPTIVSLNPCADAILAETAEPAQILAISHYSHDPRASSMDMLTARRFRSTGGTAEEVLALDPDMVVASTFLAPATRAALENSGIRVESVGMVSSVAESRRQVMQIATLAGDPAAGRALVAQIDRAAKPVEGPREKAVLWQAGGIVPGGSALVSELLGLAGFDKFTAERGLTQAAYLPLERVLADPPDLLLVSGSEAGQSHPVLSDVPDMRIARFDPSLVYCGGPTIIRAMERLVALRRG